MLVRKLEYFAKSGSERHLRDAATMLRVSANVIDRSALDGWIERRGLERQLGEAEVYEV